MLRQNVFFALVLLGSIAFGSQLVPDSPKDISWVRSLLVLAPNLLLPIGLSKKLGRSAFVLLGCAWAFGLAYGFSPGWLAGLLAAIWLCCTLWLAYSFLWVRIKEDRLPSNWSGKAAFLFLPIGAAWGLADRLGWQPLAFQSTIVLLTAVHFHYAGFLLLFLADQYLLPSDRPWHKWLDLSLVAGVPLVAIGITLTEWNGPLWVETFAATVMALGGLGVVWVFMREGWANLNSWFGIAMMIGSSCLGVGMLLAMAYGWRPYLALRWLDIPWMYAVHGSLNASAITLLLLAWYSHPVKKGTGSSS